MARMSLAAGFVASAACLQGCSVPTHTIGYWQQADNYLKVYEFKKPGAENKNEVLNSCMMKDVPLYLQCSGHGSCKSWTSQGDLKFCECDQEWADPECSTNRKSQWTAFALSMFGGFLGLDQFYLGFFMPYGLIKLLTLGGFGIWWIYDMVRIGSSPVSTAENFKLAANVPHWAFVLSVLAFAGFLALAYSVWSLRRHKVRQQKEILVLKAESAAMSGKGGNSFSGYGSTLR
eukprot:TRINITY_DN11386_c0_g1_i1.p1 TRINITY_DN11386_c0_g1~~TRINITY_DN11386_c0_g1_i1.p1  ORF type:complete len:264 (-),score=42.93 TRINITY_DN11386_c0_g1_i1:128-823(-)